MHLSQYVSACLIPPMHFSPLTDWYASTILGVSVELMSTGFRLILLLILAQHSSIGFKNGEYGGIKRGL